MLETMWGEMGDVLHVCSHDHISLCHWPHELTKYKEACYNYSKPETLDVHI